MADFHHNIFYYYRGALLSDQDRERQLENNTTKTLVNTLSHCSPVVSEQFLDWLGIKTTKPSCTNCKKRASVKEESRGNHSGCCLV